MKKIPNRHPVLEWIYWVPMPIYYLWMLNNYVNGNHGTMVKVVLISQPIFAVLTFIQTRVRRRHRSQYDRT